ncbi:uncharacterized protein LOC136079107 [Hydra vulgaris]|uniref:Uncharacterized protein LOC136079107 n=1 Tax=Hydra vulgaris TaxID=6087 RepID=A0ABM4BP42_HYDVU
MKIGDFIWFYCLNLKKNYLILASIVTLCTLFGLIKQRNELNFKHFKYFPYKNNIEVSHNIVLNLTKTKDGPWASIPSFELNIRLSSINPRWYQTYHRWFLKSLKLFWPKELNNLTIVLNSEISQDHALGNQISLIWPFPKVVFIDKPDPKTMGITELPDRFRMYYDAFFPELYTSAEFIGFVDTDTLFVTPVTPQNLFEGNKPVVIGVAGYGDYALCTEFMLKEKQLMICMSYFPVTIKVAHLIDMRGYIEKLHNKSFAEVFGEAVFKLGKGTEGCLCQFAIMCNYVYRFHRSEYSFKIQVNPNNNIANNFTESEKIPFVRVAIHSRHSIPNQVLDPMAKNSITMFNERIKEGICMALGFQWCPNVFCAEFSKGSIQRSLFAFEYYDWTWDKRCLKEQEKHYLNVKNLFEYQLENKVLMLGMYENQASSCMLL